MRRLLVAVGITLLSLVLLSRGALPAAASGHHRSLAARPAATTAAPAMVAPRDDLDLVIADVLAAVDEFWRGEAASLGFAYSTPHVVLERDGVGVPDACDDGPPVVEHYYCADDQTLALDINSSDQDSFASETHAGQPGVVVEIIGHEWGHHIQNLLDVDNSDSVRYELQADCLGGLFARFYSVRNDWVAEGQIADAIASVREVGDPVDLPAAERTHGTANQRETAWRQGFEATGPSGCGL